MTRVLDQLEDGRRLDRSVLGTRFFQQLNHFSVGQERTNVDQDLVELITYDETVRRFNSPCNLLLEVPGRFSPWSRNHGESYMKSGQYY